MGHRDCRFHLEEPASDEQPVRIVLTPEHRETIRRLSRQHVDAIEVQPDDVQQGGGPLRFLWRLSASSGIPRQAWVEANDSKDKE